MWVERIFTYRVKLEMGSRRAWWHGGMVAMVGMRHGSRVYRSGVMEILLTEFVPVVGADMNLRYHDQVRHWNAGLQAQ
jgi:hypothetical protein